MTLIVLIAVCIFVGIIEAEDFCKPLISKVDKITLIWSFIFVFVGATVCAPFLLFQAIYKKHFK